MTAPGSATVGPLTAHIAELGKAYPFQLQQCGTLSAVDFDGSVWDVVGAQDGNGGNVTDAQLGELAEQATGMMALIRPDVAVFKTGSGLILALSRHEGKKPYPPCG